MPHRLQTPEHALYFGLIVGKQQRIARCGQLLFNRGQGGFAPELPVRYAVDQSFARVAPQVAEQVAGSLRIAWENHQDVALVRLSQTDHEWNFGAPVQPADVPPRNGGFSDLYVALVNLNRGAGSQVKHQDRARDEETSRNPANWPTQTQPA